MTTPTDPIPHLTYIGQMLWLISSQLDALLGGRDYPVPDAATLLPPTPGTPPEALVERLKGDRP